MAIIQVGPVVSDIRGSINGVTFGRNPAGLFARQRVVPVDPSTPKQNERRTQLANMAVLWRTVITQAQRDSWNTLGTTTIFQNSLGEDFNPSGFQLFIRTNVLRLIAGKGVVTTAPPQAVIQLGTLTIVHTPGTGIQLTAVVGTEVTNGEILFQRSPPVSVGINFLKSPLLDLFAIQAEDVLILPITLYLNAGLVADRAYFLRVRAIQDAGEASAGAFFRVVTSDPL